MARISENSLKLTRALADYTVPQEVLSYKPQGDDLKFQFGNGDGERKLYCYQPLTDEERSKIEEFDAHVKSTGQVIDPELRPFRLAWILDKHSKGCVQTAAERLEQTRQWRIEQFRKPMLDTDFMEDLKQGCFYIGGRDKGLRPMFVIRVDRLFKQTWSDERVLEIVVFMLEYERAYLFVPGICEQHVLLFDLNGIGLWAVTSRKSLLGKITKVIGSHYIGTTYKIFAINPPGIVKALWGIAKNFLTERQQQKVVIVDGGDSALTDLFPALQLEEQYGGKRPNIAAPFYPFTCVQGPFSIGSTTLDKNAIKDVHLRLAYPPWVLYSNKEDEAATPLRFELRGDVDRQHPSTVALSNLLEKSAAPQPAAPARQSSAQDSAVLQVEDSQAQRSSLSQQPRPSGSAEPTPPAAARASVQAEVAVEGPSSATGTKSGNFRPSTGWAGGEETPTMSDDPARNDEVAGPPPPLFEDNTPAQKKMICRWPYCC